MQITCYFSDALFLSYVEGGNGDAQRSQESGGWLQDPALNRIAQMINFAQSWFGAGFTAYYELTLQKEWGWPLEIAPG